MRIKGIIWLPNVVDKLDWKHGIVPDEVEELFGGAPRYRRIERGKVRGEDVYAAMGQTEAGRYLIVFFIHKKSGAALVISARDMTPKERRRYGRKK
jgi:uncharacterized DUF497 family protein